VQVDLFAEAIDRQHVHVGLRGRRDQGGQVGAFTAAILQVWQSQRTGFERYHSHLPKDETNVLTFRLASEPLLRHQSHTMSERSESGRYRQAGVTGKRLHALAHRLFERGGQS
jgi:hypothetical protein